MHTTNHESTTISTIAVLVTLWWLATPCVFIWWVAARADSSTVMLEAIIAASIVVGTLTTVWLCGHNDRGARTTHALWFVHRLSIVVSGGGLVALASVTNHVFVHPVLWAWLVFNSTLAIVTAWHEES